MWKSVESSWNLQRHLIPFMQDVPFYAEISRHIQKKFTTNIPTLAVAFDPKADELIMWVNPYFMGGGTYKGPDNKDIVEKGLTNAEIRGSLTHEFDHIVFGHLGTRNKEPALEWNISTDLAIDSLFLSRTKNDPSMALPQCALVPGVRPFIDPDKFSILTPAQKKATTSLADCIENLPPLKASEWYFQKIIENRKQNSDGKDFSPAEMIIAGIDNHDGWNDSISDEMHEYIEGKIKSIIEKAIRHADSHSNGWGNIPAELREEIRRSVSTVVNWRAVLRQFVGTLARGNRTTSIKRINKRYPYIHPGIKRNYVAKLLVAIDESGSVDDNMLEMFFAELEQLTKRVDVTLLHFDCSCSTKDLQEWKKRTRPKLSRKKTGGTDFNAPTRLANDPKNRGLWDGLLILTDGQAPAPEPSRIKRGWVLGKNRRLLFETNETQIFLNDTAQIKGAWR